MSVILTTSLPAAGTMIGTSNTPAPPYAASTYYVIITSSGSPATAWNTTAPAWSVAGIAGSTVAGVSVIDATHAAIMLNIATLAGTVRTNLTLTDTTSGGSVQMLVTPASLLVSDNFVGAAPTFVGHVASYPAANAPVWTQKLVSGGVAMAYADGFNIIDDGTGHLRPNYQGSNFWYSLDPANGQPPISNNTNSYLNSGIYNRQAVGSGNFSNPQIGWGICLDDTNANGYFLSFSSGAQRFYLQKITSGTATDMLPNNAPDLVDYNQNTLTPVQFGCLVNGDGTSWVWAMIGAKFVVLGDNPSFPVGKFGLLGYQNNNTGGNFGQQISIAPLSIAVAQVAASGHLVKAPTTPYCALGSNTTAFNLISTPPGSLFGPGVTDTITLADGTAGGSFKNVDGSTLTPIVLSDASPTVQFLYTPARLTGTNITASGVASNSAAMTPSAAVMVCAYDPVKPVGANAPMKSAPPLTGMVPYATSAKSDKLASNTYVGFWYSSNGPTSGVPQCLGFDISNLSAGQKTRVLVRLESAQSTGAHDVAGLYNAAPDASISNFTLEINRVDAAGTPPSDTSSNWIACPTFSTPTDYFAPDPNAITGNIWRTTVHACDLTGANWFRIKCTNAYGQKMDANGVFIAACHTEFYDVRNFVTLADWERGFAGNIFLTDSVGDNSWMFVTGNSYASNFAAKGYNPLVTTLTYPGSHTYDFTQGGAGYAIFQRILKRSPGRFVNIALATNDLSAGGQDVNCLHGLDTLAVMCLMAGKVPVVCTPPYASNGSPSPAGAALNANLDDTAQLPAAGYTGPHLGDQILTVYPSQRSWWIAGPDETTYFRNNPSQMHVSDIHPIDAGVAAWLNNWAQSDSANIYSVQASNVSTPTVSSVAVTPASPSVVGLATQQFISVVSGANNPSQTVAWSLSSGVGSISASGLYTAPNATSAAQAAVVRATSVLDNTKSGTASITVPAVIVTVSGAASGADGGIVNLTANGGTSYVWSTDAGSIDQSGHLTLPASGSGTAHASALDASGASGTIGVAYGPAAPTVSGVAVSPATANVAGRATQQLTSVVSGTNSPSQTVVWSLVSGVGAVSSSGLYTAPNATSSAQSAVVRATSVADNTKSGTSAITVGAVIVSVTGAGSGINGAVVNLTASGGTSYVWAASAGSIDQTGHLTLPSSGSGTSNVTVTDASGAVGAAAVTYAPAVATVSGVTITPASPSVAGLASQQFFAVVGGTNNPSQSVAWSLVSGAGSVNSNGLYTAPVATSAVQTGVVRATSVADNTKSATSAVTVAAVIVTITGAASGLDAALVNLTASGGSAYAWTTDVGSIDQSGHLTLPSTGSGTAHATATDTTGAQSTYAVTYAPGVVAPTITGAISLSSATPNQGATVTVTMTLTGLPQGDGVTYVWTLDGLAQTATTATISLTAPSVAGAKALRCVAYDTTANVQAIANATLTVPSVVLTFAASGSVQVGATVAVSLATVTGTVATPTYTTPEGGAYSGGIYTPPTNAASGASYRIVASVGGQSATCIITIASASITGNGGGSNVLVYVAMPLQISEGAGTLPAQRIDWKQGATSPVLTLSLLDSNGVPLNLIGCLQINLRLRQALGGAVVVNALMTVLYAAGGIASYKFSANDVAASGLYALDVIVLTGAGDSLYLPTWGSVLFAIN